MSSNTNETRLNPTVKKRISSMDMMRGFALVGILLMNIEWFNRPVSELSTYDFSLKGTDWAAGWLIRLFVEGKFYPLFSMLFGMGFALMLIKAKNANLPFGAWFSRRMFFLYIFGMLHMVFIWGGDILHDYAFAGFILLGWVYLVKFKWFKRFSSDRSFLRFGLILTFMPFVVVPLGGIYFGITRTPDKMGDEYKKNIQINERVLKIENDSSSFASLYAIASGDSSLKTQNVDSLNTKEELVYKSEQRFVKKKKREIKRNKEVATFTHGSFSEVTDLRLDATIKNITRFPGFPIFVCFPLFLIGYWFIASGVLKNSENHKNMFKTMMWVGFIVGLFLNIIGLFGLAHPAAKDVMELRAIAGTSYQFGKIVLTAGYLGALVLFCQTKIGKKVMSLFAPMGKMALTNYISHSIILSTLFFGYGFGMFGNISRAPQVGIVFIIIIFQMILSNIWLKYFQFGPLEWLWRSLTYLKIQPIRIQKEN